MKGILSGAHRGWGSDRIYYFSPYLVERKQYPIQQSIGSKYRRGPSPQSKCHTYFETHSLVSVMAFAATLIAAPGLEWILAALQRVW